MATTLELIIQARNSTDAGFKALIANVQAAEASTKKASAAFSQMEGAAQGMAGRLGPAGSVLAGLGPFGLVAAAGIGAASAALMELTKHADNLQALADRTGLSTKALQEFELAAKLGNSSIDAVAGAVNKMQRALVDGDKSFGKLGLSIKDMKALAPEDQLRAVAQAIERISDPAERAAARIAIFGKSGNELAGTLKAVASGAADLNGVLSDETVNAAAAVQDEVDRMGTAWDRLVEQMASVIAKNPALLSNLQQITKTLADMAAWVDRNSARIAKLVEWILRLNGAVTGMPLIGKMLGLGEESNAEFTARIAKINEMAAALRKLRAEGAGHFGGKGDEAAAKAAEKAAQRAQEAWQKAFVKAREENDKFNESLAKSGRAALDDLAKDQEKFVRESAERNMRALEATLKALEKEAEARKKLLDDYERHQQEVLDENQEMVANMRDLAAAVDDLGQAVGGVVGGFLSFAAGGFNVLATLNDIEAQSAKLEVKLIAVAQALGAIVGQQEGGSKGFMGGAMAGAGAGAMFGPWGALIGGVLGGIGGAVFGGQNEHKRVNDMRDEFIAAAGGLDRLNKEAFAAGMTLDALLNAKKVTDYQAAVDQLNLMRMREDFIKSMGGFGALQEKARALGLTLDGVINAQNVFDYQDAVNQLTDAFDVANQAQQLLTDTISKYGFTIDELGPTWQKQELDKMALQYVKELEAMNAVGADHNAIIERMGPNILEYVNQARAAGVAIPEDMRKIVEELASQGKLLDENGNAFKTAEEAGVTFGDSIKDSMAEAAKQMERLVDAIRQLFGIGGGTIDIGINPHVIEGGGHIEPPQEGQHGGVETQWGRPWILHGTPSEPEFVLRSGQLKSVVMEAVQAMGGGGDGAAMPSTLVIQVPLDGAVLAQAVVKRTRQGWVTE